MKLKTTKLSPTSTIGDFYLAAQADLRTIGRHLFFITLILIVLGLAVIGLALRC